MSFLIYSVTTNICSFFIKLLVICCVSEDEPIPDILIKEQPKTKSLWDDEDVDDNDVKESWEDEDEPAAVFLFSFSVLFNQM